MASGAFIHTGFTAQHLTDSRRGKNTQLPLAELFRQSVYSRIAGYEDVNDAERLAQDPTSRLIGSEKTWDRGAALTSRLQTFLRKEGLVGLARPGGLKRNSYMKEFSSRNARRSTAPFRDPGWKSDRSDRKEQSICLQREEDLGGVRF